MKPHDQQGEAGDNDDFGLERQSRMKRAFFKETYGALLHRGLKGQSQPLHLEISPGCDDCESDNFDEKLALNRIMGSIYNFT